MCSHGRMIDGNYYSLGFGTFRLTKKLGQLRLQADLITKYKKRKGNSDTGVLFHNMIKLVNEKYYIYWM